MTAEQIRAVADKDGVVSLEGDILASEHDPLLACARLVRGVHGVEDRLRKHETAAHVPALQGGMDRPRREIPELFQDNWAPSIRVLIGGLGLGLIAWGTPKHTFLGSALALLGAVAFLRSVRNQPLRRAISGAELLGGQGASERHPGGGGAPAGSKSVPLPAERPGYTS